MTQLETLLTRVDSLKAQWDAARPIPAPLLEQLRTDWEMLLTSQSNAIEGNTLTLGETKAILLDGITIAGKPLREHLEAIRHREALRLMTRLAQSGTPLLETENPRVATSNPVLEPIRCVPGSPFRSHPQFFSVANAMPFPDLFAIVQVCVIPNRV